MSCPPAGMRNSRAVPLSLRRKACKVGTPCGLVAWLNRIIFPSGDQAGRKLALGGSLTLNGSWFPPLAVISQIRLLTALRVNAICLPSGDQAGFASGDFEFEILRVVDVLKS